MTNSPDPLAPATLGPITLRNRVIKAATWEGMAPGALVSDQLIDYHLAVARGGVGMTTVAYLAVAPEGRTERNQIYWRPEALPGLTRLTEAIHATGAKVSAQIGHAGPVSDASSTRLYSLAPSKSFNPLGFRFNREATPEEIVRITRQHADAAKMARDVGFDCIEVHLGHNYFASSFLAPDLNRRKDEYGGSLANRAKVARGAVEAVRTAVGDDVAVIAKINLEDGARKGIQLDEAIQTVKWLEADGHLDALEMTAGSSLRDPMYLFKGGAPVKEFAAGMSTPVMRFGMGVFGKWFLKEYPWTPLYFLDKAKQVQAELSTLPLILLGGVVDKAGMDTAMAQGFGYVAMARALLREPDLINRITAEATTRSLCVHCNRCMPTIFSGTHCPEITDPTIDPALA